MTGSLHSFLSNCLSNPYIWIMIICQLFFQVKMAFHGKKKERERKRFVKVTTQSHELFFSATHLCILVHWGALCVLLILLLRMFKGQDLIKSLICATAARENTRSTNSLMSSPRFLPRCWHHCSHISGEMSAQWKKQKKKKKSFCEFFKVRFLF